MLVKGYERNQWKIAFWLAFGESRWSETYAGVADELRLSKDQLYHWAYTARAFEKLPPAQDLSFSHHAALAHKALSDEERQTLIETIREKGIGRDQTRALVKEYLAAKSIPDDTPRPANLLPATEARDSSNGNQTPADAMKTWREEGADPMIARLREERGASETVTAPEDDGTEDVFSQPDPAIESVHAQNYPEHQERIGADLFCPATDVRLSLEIVSRLDAAVARRQERGEECDRATYIERVLTYNWRDNERRAEAKAKAAK